MTTQRVMVITGTSRGLGHDLALHYLESNWVVAGCSRSETPIRHPRYHHFSVDLCDETSVVAFIRQASRLGRLEALINNAGTANMGPLALTSTATARNLLDLNVLAPFLTMRESAKIMIRHKGGRIINFSTIAVPLALAGEALYAASKAALESLTKVAAREFAPFGITVNAVGPCPVPTRLLEGVPQKAIDALLARQAIPEMAAATDVAAGVDFFLSPESRLYTGQTLYLGGIFGSQ